MGTTTERVEIPVAGGSMGGYLARPEGNAQLPAVLVFMEIFGINEHLRDVTEHVASNPGLATCAGVIELRSYSIKVRI